MILMHIAAQRRISMHETTYYGSHERALWNFCSHTLFCSQEQVELLLPGFFGVELLNDINPDIVLKDLKEQ